MTGLASTLASGTAHALPKPKGNTAPVELAKDESYWRAIARQYDVTREVVPLENGNWGVMSRPVLQAYERHLRVVNERNTFYVRREFGRDFERIRERVATALGVTRDEIALTRNATEALQALIGGYNRLRPGDGVLYADLDYDSMQAAMRWLPARRGVHVVRTAVPEPATHQGLIDAYAAALEANPRVRMMLITHLSHRTGLVLPVREIVAMARARGVDVIVDSAHAWGQIDFRLRDLDVDFVGLNLHKWMGAPLGVGAMFIRRERMSGIDPFMANDEVPEDDIRARVHTGTASFAAFLTVPDALDFQDAIGIAAKEARLRYLRDSWAETLRGHGAIEILTPEDARLHGGITSFRLRGRGSVEENVALAKQLLDEHGIFTVHRTGVAAGACVRVTPALFNARSDIERLVKALRRVAEA